MYVWIIGRAYISIKSSDAPKEERIVEERKAGMNNGIVIVTYNRLALLKECLDCVFSQTLPFSKVIVVDNHSTDGTGAYLRGLDRPELIILFQEENLGGAGGFARGFAEALGHGLDWVAAIDDDAMLENHYMERLMDYARDHREAAVLSGTVMAHGKISVIHRRRVASRLLFLERNVGEQEYWGDAFCCDCATFCGMTVRGDALKKAGLPNAEYFLWYDDTEYSLRFAEYGGVVNVNRAVLEHKVKEDVAAGGLLERTTWRHYYGYRNRYDTARRHFGTLSAWMIALEYYILMALSCLMWLSPGRRANAGFNIRMIHDALKSAQNRKFGRNEKYLYRDSKMDSKVDPKMDPVGSGGQRLLGPVDPELLSGQKHMEVS